jgi:peptide/nickel transport system permease protein
VKGWVVRRALQALVTYILATTLAFFVMRLTPGDPLARLSEDRPMPPEAMAALRARYQFDQPLLRQYFNFLGAAARGDLGRSIMHDGRPVTGLIRERLPATLLLGGVVLLLNFTIGIWLGVWQAVRRGSSADRALTAVTLTAYATPSFWLGLVLAWGVGTELHWLPVASMHDPLIPADAPPLTVALDVARHLILPALTLSITTLGATARYQRATMVEALNADFVRTARSKGLTEAAIRWRHAWRNALGPMLALFGLWLPLLVAGSVFVEAIFAWPGLGTLAYEAIASRDYPVIMGTTLLVSAMVIAGSFTADLLHRMIDPRLRSA